MKCDTHLFGFNHFDKNKHLFQIEIFVVMYGLVRQCLVSYVFCVFTPRDSVEFFFEFLISR